MARKILILSASIGTGHIRAAQAIEKALKTLDPDLHVRHEDALEFANPAFALFYQKAYNDLAKKAPEIMSLIIDSSEKSWPADEHGIAFERWNAQALVKAVSEEKPDLVICTHPLPADLISWMICKKKLWAQHAIVITDFDLNPMWLCQHYSRYFVAIEEAKQYLINIGYKGENIEVSGIPIDPVFSENKSKQDMRKKYGLDPQSDILLLSAGGMGLGPLEEMMQSLIRLKGKTQIVAICGKNESMKASLDEFVERQSLQKRVRVYGFTRQIDELMSACDIIVGKPGGLTSAESLAKGLVFVIVDPIPGQEERNSDHLLEEAVAIRCNDIEILHYKITRLLNEKSKLLRMKEAARSFAKAESAHYIARAVLAESGFESWTNEVHPLDHKCELLIEKLDFRPGLSRIKEHLKKTLHY